MAERPGSGLHRFAVLTAGATFALLFVGGLVTSTGSGLAVPDWPLSYGMVFPPMVGGVLFEHGHRLAASLVGCLTVVLALWTVIGEPRPGVRALGLLALLVVVLQGVLGGVTVLYKLPLAISVTHACLAQAFFCLTVTLALVTGPAWAAARPRVASPRLVPLATLTTVVVFAQLVMGALMRHMGAGLAIPDFPLAFGRLVPPLATPYIAVHFAHRLGALAVTAAVAVTVVAVRRDANAGSWLRRPAYLAAGLVVLQLALGASVIWTRRAGVRPRGLGRIPAPARHHRQRDGQTEEGLREAGVRDRDRERKLVEDGHTPEHALQDHREEREEPEGAHRGPRLDEHGPERQDDGQEPDDGGGQSVAVLVEDAAHHRREDLSERERPVGDGEARAGARDEPAEEEQHERRRRRRDGEAVQVTDRGEAPWKFVSRGSRVVRATRWCRTE